VEVEDLLENSDGAHLGKVKRVCSITSWIGTEVSFRSATFLPSALMEIASIHSQDNVGVGGCKSAADHRQGIARLVS